MLSYTLLGTEAPEDVSQISADSKSYAHLAKTRLGLRGYHAQRPGGEGNYTKCEVLALSSLLCQQKSLSLDSVMLIIPVIFSDYFTAIRVRAFIWRGNDGKPHGNVITECYAMTIYVTSVLFKLIEKLVHQLAVSYYNNSWNVLFSMVLMHC